METVSFFVTAGANDWDRELNGWRCDVLRLERTRLIAVFAEGSRRSEDEFAREKGVLRWQGKAPPEYLKMEVELEALGAEDTFSAEPKNEDAKHRYSLFAVAISACAGIVVAVITAVPATLALYRRPSEGVGSLPPQPSVRVAPPVKVRAHVGVDRSIRDFDACVERDSPVVCSVPAKALRDACMRELTP